MKFRLAPRVVEAVSILHPGLGLTLATASSLPKTLTAVLGKTMFSNLLGPGSPRAAGTGKGAKKTNVFGQRNPHKFSPRSKKGTLRRRVQPPLLFERGRKPAKRMLWKSRVLFKLKPRESIYFQSGVFQTS